MEDLIFKDLQSQYTDRLVLRKFNINDASDLYEVFKGEADVGIRKYINLPVYSSINDAYSYISFLEGAYNDGMSGCYAIEYEKKVIGSIEIKAINNYNANIGYVIGENYNNKGIATEALKKIIEICFEIFKFNRVEAICYDVNNASSRVMEKCSMKLEGVMRENRFKAGKFYSTRMYSILRSEYERVK